MNDLRVVTLAMLVGFPLTYGAYLIGRRRSGDLKWPRDAWMGFATLGVCLALIAISAVRVLAMLGLPALLLLGGIYLRTRTRSVNSGAYWPASSAAIIAGVVGLAVGIVRLMLNM